MQDDRVRQGNDDERDDNNPQHERHCRQATASPEPAANDQRHNHQERQELWIAKDHRRQPLPAV
jgi:hypothetical protein